MRAPHRCTVAPPLVARRRPLLVVVLLTLAAPARADPPGVTVARSDVPCAPVAALRAALDALADHPPPPAPVAVALGPPDADGTSALTLTAGARTLLVRRVPVDAANCPDAPRAVALLVERRLVELGLWTEPSPLDAFPEPAPAPPAPAPAPPRRPPPAAPRSRALSVSARFTADAAMTGAAPQAGALLHVALAWRGLGVALAGGWLADATVPVRDGRVVVSRVPFRASVGGRVDLAPWTLAVDAVLGVDLYAPRAEALDVLVPSRLPLVSVGLAASLELRLARRVHVVAAVGAAVPLVEPEIVLAPTDTEGPVRVSAVRAVIPSVSLGVGYDLFF